MALADERFTVMRLEDVERQPAHGQPFAIHLIRRSLGVRAFGVNAYSVPSAGDTVIEEHDELGGGAGKHEELYLVLNGRAIFRLDGDEREVEQGGMVFVRDPATRRSATAAEAGTTVLVVGGLPAERGVPGAWEWSVAANGAYMSKDYDRAIEIAGEGLQTSPDSPALRYNLACYSALAGRPDEAIEHLRIAVEGDAAVAEWASGDSDLDSLRDRHDWPL
jgi:tetratricopeptide (TPR) repeat protein